MQIDPVKLAEARLARAMSQEEAAIATDLSARTIQRIEAGYSASLESTKALLTIFGADILHDPEPKAVTQAQSPWRQIGAQLAGTARRSASYGFDGLRLLLAIEFALVAGAKFIIPDQTGLFIDHDGFAIGVFKDVPSGATEQLGMWITPLMLLAAGALALTIGRLRRLAQPFR